MKKILLIDDEEGIRIVWKRFHDLAEPVFRGQLEMDVASDLAQGLEKIESASARGEPYDAIIADLKFHGFGVEETISWVIEHADKWPPIIVLTGDEDIFVRRRCMMGGAASFWTKLDATDRPDLFFKDVYNRYLSRYEHRLDAP